MKTLRELHHEALHAALTDAADKQLRPQAVDAAVRLAEIDPVQLDRSEAWAKHDASLAKDIDNIRTGINGFDDSNDGRPVKGGLKVSSAEAWALHDASIAEAAKRPDPDCKKCEGSGEVRNTYFAGGEHEVDVVPCPCTVHT